MARGDLPALLFFSGELRLALEENDRRLGAEVEHAPEEHLMQADIDEWARALVERYKVEAPHLHARDHRPHAAGLHHGVPGRGSHPFEGDKAVFSLHPSSFTLNPPRAKGHDGELRDVVEYPHDRPANIKAHTDELVRKVEGYLRTSRGDVEA
jgi:hypothetical protein